MGPSGDGAAVSVVPNVLYRCAGEATASTVKTTAKTHVPGLDNGAAPVYGSFMRMNSPPPNVTKSPASIVLALAFTLAMVALGYLTVGIAVALPFAVGFSSGFVLWLTRPLTASFRTIKGPYIAGLIAYVIHRAEEEIAAFVPALEELGADMAVSVTHPWSLTLVALSLIWFLSPLLIKRGIAFGHYAAWTIFTSFGILELAHFVFPFFTPEPYGYFPGMWTAPLIVATGWWGLWRMWHGDRSAESHV